MEADKEIDDDVTGNGEKPQLKPATDETNAGIVDGIIQSKSKPKLPENGSSSSTVYVHQRKNAKKYNTKHRKRGSAVIFNQKTFEPWLPVETRHGTDEDCRSLERTLRSMSFEVVIHHDLTFLEIIAQLDALAAADFEDCDCLLIVALSHGKEDEIFAHDSVYSIDLLFHRFSADKCHSLAGKPKIFILQSCRGNTDDSGVEVEYGDVPDSVCSFTMPVFTDFLYAYSTIPGCNAWRNKQRGSRYIQSLCEELNAHWRNHDLLEILTFVNQKVAVRYEEKNGQEQTCSFTSQLTRTLKFSPKTGENNEDTSHPK